MQEACVLKSIVLAVLALAGYEPLFSPILVTIPSRRTAAETTPQPPIKERTNDEKKLLSTVRNNFLDWMHASAQIESCPICEHTTCDFWNNVPRNPRPSFYSSTYNPSGAFSGAYPIRKDFSIPRLSLLISQHTVEDVLATCPSCLRENCPYWFYIIHTQKPPAIFTLSETQSWVLEQLHQEEKPCSKL